MRIKMTKKAMVAGFTDPVPKGGVIESDNEGHIAEYKALVTAGLAKTTNEAVSDPNTFASVGGNTPKISGIVTTEAGSDAEAAILDGNVGEVTERLAGLDAAALKRLGKLEAKGKDRVGVHSAIESAQAGLAAGDGAE